MHMDSCACVVRPLITVALTHCLMEDAASLAEGCRVML